MGFKPDLPGLTGFLQCFDTVGLVIRPVKIVPEMTYYVLNEMLNPTHSLTLQEGEKDADSRLVFNHKAVELHGTDRNLL